MTSIAIDRTDGLSSAAAIKGPCRVATTANITLSGTQTIDGVAVVAGDRVLVKDQTTGSQNGIYVVDTGSWRRAKDFNRTRDVVEGTAVTVTDGTVSAGAIYFVTTANPISIGTTAVTFAATLDLRYLRIISNPEKNLLQRGFVADDESYHDENTAILNEAADEITGNFGGLYLPLGQYFVNEDVAPIVDTTAYFRGDGKAASRLLFRPKNGDYGTPVAAGIRFNLSSLGYTVGVRDLSVYVKGLSSAAAIRIERPDDQNSGGFAGPIIENVETKGLSLTYGFANGLYLNNCWQARVVNFDDTGKYLGLTAYDYAPMIGSSIVFDGNSTAVVMEQIHATHRDSLLFTIEGSFSEGVKLLHSEAVNVNRGVVAHSALGAVEGSSPPGMTIFDCHFACNETAIEGYLRPQVIISQCLIYNRLGGFAIAPSTPPADVAALETAASAFIALYLNNTNQSKALDNIMIGFGRGTFLFGDTSIRTEIRGNTIEDAETGFNGNNNSTMHDTGNYLNSTPTERTGWTGSTSGTNIIW